MVRLLYADGRQVFRSHPADCGHVVAGAHEQIVILLVVEVGQPRQENLMVRHAIGNHFGYVEGTDGVHFRPSGIRT